MLAQPASIATAMSRHTASRCDCDDSTQTARRSARIQQQQKAAVQRSANFVQCGRASVNSRASSQSAAKRKRKRNAQGEEDCDSQSPTKRSSRSVNITPSHEDEAVDIKCAVRFDDNEPLEALSDDGAAEEAAAKAAALSVSAEFLANLPENAPYVALSPREMPCPPDAVARMTPSRTLDSKGRVLLQYPIRYILAYRIEVSDLYNYIKSVKRDFHDFQGTLLYFQLRTDEELDMRHSQGMSEMVYMGERVWTMVMSQSDHPETLPYPTQRIRKFQEIMGCTSQPIIYPFRPRAHRLKAGAK